MRVHRPRFSWFGALSAMSAWTIGSVPAVHAWRSWLAQPCERALAYNRKFHFNRLDMVLSYLTS
jgi:hypothetical protein